MMFHSDEQGARMMLGVNRDFWLSGETHFPISKYPRMIDTTQLCHGSHFSALFRTMYARTMLALLHPHFFKIFFAVSTQVTRRPRLRLLNPYCLRLHVTNAQSDLIDLRCFPHVFFWPILSNIRFVYRLSWTTFHFLAFLDYLLRLPFFQV